tara:strand:- start:253 stop:462 length:210 start_codon:yes stop_codon:yes gene_type:complete
MFSNLLENILNKSKTNISEILSNKTLVFYILIGMLIVYFLYNILTTTIKYPIIIIVGIVVGKKLYDNSL